MLSRPSRSWIAEDTLTSSCSQPARKSPEFVDVKRFGYVIVRTEIQSPELIGLPSLAVSTMIAAAPRRRSAPNSSKPVYLEEGDRGEPDVG